MTEERITRIVYDPANPPVGETDWERVRKMTESEIDAAARSDPDALPLTEAELAKFRRVTPRSSERR
jgi:hypothetical protein